MSMWTPQFGLRTTRAHGNKDETASLVWSWGVLAQQAAGAIAHEAEYSRPSRNDPDGGL